MWAKTNIVAEKHTNARRVVLLVSASLTGLRS